MRTMVLLWVLLWPTNRISPICQIKLVMRWMHWAWRNWSTDFKAIVARHQNKSKAMNFALDSVWKKWVFILAEAPISMVKNSFSKNIWIIIYYPMKMSRCHIHGIRTIKLTTTWNTRPIIQSHFAIWIGNKCIPWNFLSINCGHTASKRRIQFYRKRFQSKNKLNWKKKNC